MLYEICAILASSNHQPIPWTAFNFPSFPGPLPFSRRSSAGREALIHIKAWSKHICAGILPILWACSLVANMFTLKASRNFLAPTMLAPQDGTKVEGPKSGFQSGCAIWYQTVPMRKWRCLKIQDWYLSFKSFVLPCSDLRHSPTVVCTGSKPVQIDGNVQLLSQTFSQPLGTFHTIIHRCITNRDKRANVHCW